MDTTARAGLVSGDAAGGREALALESGVEGLEERERLADAPRRRPRAACPRATRAIPARRSRRRVSRPAMRGARWAIRKLRRKQGADVDHAASASQLSTR